MNVTFSICLYDEYVLYFWLYLIEPAVLCKSDVLCYRCIVKWDMTFVVSILRSINEIIGIMFSSACYIIISIQGIKCSIWEWEISYFTEFLTVYQVKDFHHLGFNNILIPHMSSHFH